MAQAADTRFNMAAKLGQQIARVVTDALEARDRAEMRVINGVLSLVESPRRHRTRAATPRRKARNRRVAGRSRAVKRHKRSR
jgi:hypothetical protein